MDSVFLNNEDSSINIRSGGLSSIPTWRLPLSKTYSSGLKSLLYQDEDTEKDKETIPGDNNNFFRARSMSSDNNFEDAQTVIQILLPCIICNRTFSPEALERHSKICTRVRANDKRPTRPTFDSAIMRIKDTKMADFIPPPPEYSQHDSCFTRNGRGRSSFQGSPTRSSFGKGSTSAAPWRRQRASSTPKTFISHNGGSDNYGVLDDQLGSPDDDERSMTGGNHSSLPSYARALSPTDDCPYCLRSFGLKAYDRHVKYCKEVWERKQFEIQPTPVELEEARERQEIRTKYKPMKGSNSCSSLRSVSPPRSKDQGIGSRNFASAALSKLFGGLKRTENRTLFRTPDRMKKSNESLTSSCYGDFARSNSMRRHEPSPSRLDPRYISQKSHPMQLNTSSNVQKKTKSTDSLASLNSVPSSGYGPGGSYLNNFSRNSKTRSSLNNNFYRTKRVEPEGLENTGSSNTTNPLIITPMNFYSKQRLDSSATNDYKDYKQNELHDSQNKSIGTLFNSDSNSHKYDPYEKAAKQLEELLRTQPLLHKNSNSNSRTQRRIGIDRAFASVNPVGSMPDDNMTTLANGESDNSRGNGFANSKTTGNKSNMTDPPQYNSLNQFATGSEDSYWEDILDKKSRSRDEQESRDHQRDHRDTMQLSDSSEPINNCGDGQEASQEKSRAVSNISSADSAFSRSDGTDLEFEALESLVTKSLGNVPLTSSSGLPESQSSPSKSSDLISSRHPPMMMTSFVSKPPSLTVESTGGLNPTMAKFCHECGTCYPTPAAKFCPECGERRVVNV